MAVVVGIAIVAWMGVIVRPVLFRMFVVVDVGIGLVRVLVHVLMEMIVSVAVGVFVSVRLAPVRVFVGVYMSVFMPVDVFVFMTSFHDGFPPLQLF